MATSKVGMIFNSLKTRIPKKPVLSTVTGKKQKSTALLHEDQIATCPFRNAFNTMDEALHAPREEVQNDTSIQSFEHIPGPKGLPVLGTLLDYFKKDGLRFNKMFDAYRQRALEYGPIYKEKIATISTVVISDPEEYSKVIRSEGKYPIRRQMEPMAYYRQQKGMNGGLVNDQGEDWHRLRTVTAKKMLKMKEVLAFCEPMNEVGDDYMDHLKAVSQPNHEVNDLEKEIFKWAMESIGTFLFEERIGCFGTPPPKQAQAFIDNLRGLFQKLQPLMYNLPIYRLYKTKLWKEYEAYSDNVMEIGKFFVDKKVNELKAASESGSEDRPKAAFLTYLMSQQSITPEDALSTAVDLLTAATETTSNAILWTMYCLAKNPEVQEKLYQETKNVLGVAGAVTPTNISKLSYVKAVLKESFRKYPITWATSRMTQEDMEVAGFNIPAGTHVQANLYCMFRDEKLFPEPSRFSPERWLRENKMDSKLKSLSNLVWGHGARMCIGRRFAEQEMHIILSKIVQNFRLEYDHEDIEPTLNTVMTPDRPLLLKFIPRQGA